MGGENSARKMRNHTDTLMSHVTDSHLLEIIRASLTGEEIHLY